jgi:tetratricopeptide (TPR) repeat protein
LRALEQTFHKALTYANQRNHEYATLEHLLLALTDDVLEKALGPDNPGFAKSLNNLAFLYGQQSRYSDAEPLFKRALAIGEKALGPDHPDVGPLLNNLAGLYNGQGRYADAEPLFKRALAIGRESAWSRPSQCRRSAQQSGRALHRSRPLRRR